MSTLLTLLRQRARADEARVALSYKEQGAWRQLEWAGVERATLGLRSALAAAGFGPGAVLLVSKRASARTLLAVLAALSLGGTVSGVDEPLRKVAPAAPRWAFARDSSELARSREAAATGRLSGILFDDQCGPSSMPVGVPVLSYSALVSLGPSSSVPVPVFAQERCVLELGLASDFEARQLLTSWLTQGFELGVPEELASVERDAGELGVSLRIASSSRWDAWAHALGARLAAPGSRKRRFVDWALAVNAQPSPRAGWARWVSALLVVGPLRRALRLRDWRRAVSLDSWPSPKAALLLGGLGVRLELWESKAFDEPREVSSTGAVSSEGVGELARQSA